MRELRHKPVAMLRLDDDTPFTDYSGFGVIATRASTEVKGPSLTRSASYSQAFDSVKIASIAVPDFMTTGTERASFSVTFTCRPATIPAGSSDYTLFTRDDNTWFFLFSQNKIQFTLSYSDLTLVTLLHDYQVEQKLDVALVFNSQQTQLWLNGEMVESVDLLDVNAAEVFASVSDNFNIYSTNSAYSILMNNLTFYKHALTGEEINDIKSFNNTTVPDDVAQSFAGEVIPLGYEQRRPYIEILWNTETEWNLGQFQQTCVDNDRLEAQKDSDGLTLSSSWMTAITFVLPVGTVPNFESSYMWWEGKNVIVEVSGDGISWLTVTRGQNLNPTSTPVDQDSFQIRVSFAAGLDEGFITSLLMRAFTGTSVQQTVDSRLITYTGDTVGFDKKSSDKFCDDNGVKIGSSSSLTIGVLSGGENNKTLGTWVRPVGTSLTITGWSGSTSYVNGLAGSTLIANQWNLVHLTNVSGITGATVFGANQQIGEVSLFPTVLSAGDIASIHRAYTGIPIIRVDAADIVTSTESVSPSAIYSFDKLSTES